MSHAETPKTGATESTPTSARPSEPLTAEAVEEVMATLQRLPSTLPETFEEQLAKLGPVDGCPCMICAHIARVHAHLERNPS